jgi:hypothetical protein
LIKKKQKIKNAESPPGGIQPTAPAWLPILMMTFFVVIVLVATFQKLHGMRFVMLSLSKHFH